jgi:ELWxxDGT repeat protein
MVIHPSSEKKCSNGAREPWPIAMALLAVALVPSVLAERTHGPGEVNQVQNDLPLPEVVRDINPGEASSAPEMFVPFGGTVVFRANDGAHGVELWRTDGTAEGTRLIVDLLPGALNGVPGSLTVAGDNLFFHGFTEPTGSKVFISDGTAEGTRLLVDTFPGAPSGPFGPPLPSQFTALGDKVLFAATDSKLGYELWTTDGTPAGTGLVKDIHPGEQWSIPVGLLPFANRAFFAADDSFIPNPDGTATFNRELFVTDGTAAGTVRLLDINPGPQPSIPILFTPLANQFLFRADDGTHGTELWTSDGTAPGTRMLTDINVRGASNPMNLTVIGDRVFFGADNGVTGSEPWVTDGTDTGTHLVRDINGTGDSHPMHFTPLGDQIIFAADDGQSGNELWVTDGSDAGTRMIADINPGAGYSSPREFVAAGDTLFFTALADFDDATKTSRTRLWMTDGTAEGTTPVWDAPGRFPGYTIRNLTLLGGQLLFSAPTGVDAEGLSTNTELLRLDVSDGDNGPQ